MVTQSEKRQSVFSRLRQMKDTGWLYQTLLESDIPKTINSNGIFLNISCLSDSHLEILYKSLADVTTGPNQATAFEHKIPELKMITSKPVLEKSYLSVKLTKLQKQIISSI
uniref:Uncharacterized protein n=1 Tax=viral metagenome TaxID=1070528 RepID=A0A6C0F508_9ZZZZ|tara:strand:- start:9794 stop:10126 length:333 start_codon:yes stop_codon:yes gene_type:complete